MIKPLTLITVISMLTSCNLNDNENKDSENIINKVNAVENQWTDYNGDFKKDGNMMRSQFIPYDSKEKYIINNDAYVSYYEGKDFITTELHEGGSELESLKEADGIIISFNKDNKNGIKLINKE